MYYSTFNRRGNTKGRGIIISLTYVNHDLKIILTNTEIEYSINNRLPTIKNF